MRAAVGDSVKVRTPAGPEAIEVIAIAYDSFA
jgi:transcription elongation GreA/GreB family factor